MTNSTDSDHGLNSELKNVISSNSSKNRIENLSQNITNEVEDQRLLVPSDRNFYFVNKSDISNHK